MTTFVFRNGEWVDRAEAEPLNITFGRSAMVIRDQMDPVALTTNGKLYDSKSAYYAAVKAAGCEIVGNDKAWIDQKPSNEPQGVGQSIKDAIDQLEARL